MIGHNGQTVCMKGSIQYRSDRNTYYISWYHSPRKKTYKISRYKGEMIYDLRIAKKLLAMMQGDVENGVFRIEKYISTGYTDVIPYMVEWLKTVKNDLSPATYKDYSNSVRNHLTPFFEENQIQLHEIQYDTLRKLLTSIKRKGKGKSNVMYCFHACLTYAWRSQRIPAVPPFPEKKYYRIQEPVIRWISEERQLKILAAIPQEHQPIFYWLKYHLRRPCEAMSLYRCDYSKDHDVFIIRRSVSAKEVVNRTKTDVEHVIPCHSEFKPYMPKPTTLESPFMFINENSRTEGKRYTSCTLNKIWKKACNEVGEDISLYSGLKHSSCSQYINEKNMSISDLQMITDHARLDSVKKYAKMEVSRKRELLERRVVPHISPKEKIA